MTNVMRVVFLFFVNTQNNPAVDADKIANVV